MQEQFQKGRNKFFQPLAHLAPCGAHCMGGGVDYREKCVHIPSFGACPKCGKSGTINVYEIIHENKEEKVSFHQYTETYQSDLGFRIEREYLENGVWVVKKRFPTNFPESLEKTIEWAKNYVEWL
ncbi:hypothetical protein TDB9533_04744 [Thalassocella blandensis]|nr:hypothetical protein TDB9533_04744 [Thalassocella blandensis]